jgi:transaldolase
MKAIEKLHNASQSPWLDNITRGLLTSGTLKRYIETLSVTGLTSNPTIFDHAISKSAAYAGGRVVRRLRRSVSPVLRAGC